MKIIKCQQGTNEWFEARRGIPSASNFDLIVTTKGEPSKQRTKYLYKLIGEKISNTTEEGYQNGAMLRGKELEAEARDFYSFVEGIEVNQIGFCLANGYGASPDGLIGDDGLLEIKCPNMATHVGYLLGGTLPTEYFQQVQGQLLVTNREWCDFMSYYPGIKPFIFRAYPDEIFLKLLKIELIVFCRELEELTQKLR